MVPTDETARHLKQQGMTSIADLSPNIDPSLSFSPGPRMNLRSRRPAGDMMFPQAFPGSPFKVLAILVEFSDKPSSVADSFFDSLVFSTTPGEKSLANFYSEASYGQLDIVTVNLPSALDWRTAPQPYSYYVNGQYCMGSYPHNCQKLAEDLVTQVAALPEVYLPDYDNNGDGWLDTFFVIHTGSGAELSHNPNDVWSHSWWINNYGDPFVTDDVYIGSYTIEPEFWFDPGDMTHGVYAHEFGHALGLPDLYDIDGSSEGVGDWSLMSGGSWNGFLGDTPALFDAWSRSYLEFNPVNNITAFNGPFNLPNIQQNQFGSLFRIESGRMGEYWLLENRQNTGSDAFLPGSGLLIWHVDDNLVDANNQFECKLANNYLCNGTPTRHFRVALEQADGLRDLEYNRSQGDTGDPYPGDSSNVYFNFKTNPNTSSYYFPQSPNVEVCGISPSDITMSAAVSPYTLGLLSPASGWKTNDNTPDFVWSGLACAASYEIQIDNNSDFLTPAHNHATGARHHSRRPPCPMGPITGACGKFMPTRRWVPGPQPGRSPSTRPCPPCPGCTRPSITPTPSIGRRLSHGWRLSGQPVTGCRCRTTTRSLRCRWSIYRKLA
jgi:M6 family metalloprotease-like protein